MRTRVPTPSAPLSIETTPGAAKAVPATAPRRPFTKVPWIEIGNGTCASLVMLAQIHLVKNGWGEAMAFGILSWIGWRLAFGTDVGLDELYGAVPGYAAEETARILAVGRDALSRASRACAGLEGSSQKPALEAVLRKAGGIVEDLERDPRRLPGARRFIDLCLTTLATASEKYAELRARTEANQMRDGMRESYASFLEDMKGVCDKQALALVANDETELDVDMTVARRLLAMHGMTSGPRPDGANAESRTTIARG